jgi:hypothetical protein
VLEPIGLDAASEDGLKAQDIGRKAAQKAITKRSDDGINNFVDYTQQPGYPGVYQATPGGAAVPDTPQARFIRLFGGVGDVTRFRAPPPPSVNGSEYEKFVVFVKSQGERVSAVRSAHDTETAYFWRESSPM